MLFFKRLKFIVAYINYNIVADSMRMYYNNSDIRICHKPVKAVNSVSAVIRCKGIYYFFST